MLRSLFFSVVFHVSFVLWLIAALPTLLMRRRAVIAVARAWGRFNLWLLRAICGIRVEWRGREKIPAGPLLVASKHQSAWETFALIPLFSDPSFVLKRELMRIPLFGWLMRKAELIPIDRGAAREALATMTRALHTALDEGRQVIVFPEGTRRAPGAAPDYKLGVVFLYAEGRVPCLPIALNSGLFWPRHGFLRRPGTIRVDILDPIPPGLNRRVFFKRLQNDIETATRALTEAELRARGETIVPEQGGARGPRDDVPPRAPASRSRPSLDR